MEAAESVAIASGGVVAFTGGLAFLWAGVWEIAVGRRPPGFLGWALINRNTVRQSNWSPTRWRRNGFQVFGMALGLLVLALWALFAALRVTG